MEQRQLTLGELIGKLERIDSKSQSGDVKRVDYDFGTSYPTNIDSWRGDYSHAALGYKLSGYDSNKGHHGYIEIDALLEELKSSLDKTYEGWKGGDYRYDEDTPLWIANPGNSGNTAIYDVLDDGWRVVLLTCYWDY
jgi:hypothetical protein